MQRKKKSRKTKILLIIIGAVVVMLIAARITLPYVLLKFVNRELTKIPDYRGNVQDIDVALIRGAYSIKSIRLDKVDGKIPVPFFSADVIDLSIEWKPLFHGRLVGKIIVRHPELNFVKGPTEATSQTTIDKKWTDVVGDLMPLKLNRFEIIDGDIHYRDYHSSPKFNLFTTDVHILAQNLSNARKKDTVLPSSVDATADIYKGQASLHMKLDALNETPTFDVKAALVDMDITDLNNFLDAYARLTVKQGSISIYTEAAAKDGKIIGYTKPLIKDLKVVNWEKDKHKPLKIAYEAVVGAVAWVFKNHGKDQLATRVEFEGNLKDPHVNIWNVIGEVLHNAFIQALYPSLENSINLDMLNGKKPPRSKMKMDYEKTVKNNPPTPAKKK